MKKLVTILLLALVTFAGNSEATQTKIIVRALAKDAKFIGTSMGGALVVIRDSESGEILAKGLTSGSTGNTQTIMKNPLIRGALLSDVTTAKFQSTIDIAEPTLVTIEVQAPQAQKQSMITASTQVWLIPGKEIVGDGVVLEIPGFAVNVLSPQVHERMKLDGNEAVIPIKVNVVMM